MALKLLKNPAKLQNKIDKTLPHSVDVSGLYGEQRFFKIAAALAWCKENLSEDNFLTKQQTPEGDETLYNSKALWFMMPSGEFRLAKRKHAAQLLDALHA